MAKKSKGEKKSEKQDKNLKKLRKAVEKLGEQNEELAESVKELRKEQKEFREELENVVRGLGSRLEASPDEDEASSVTVDAEGAIVSGDADGLEVPESSDAPSVSADDEIGGDGEPLEGSPEAPTVSADDGISAGTPKTASKATESAKRKAEELGVDISAVEGTGSRNRVTVSDVEQAAGEG